MVSLSGITESDVETTPTKLAVTGGAFLGGSYDFDSETGLEG